MNEHLEKQDEKNLIPSNIIRTDTVFSKLPVHNLGKRGSIKINITRRNDEGEIKLLWEVSADEKYGAPRQLAYRLDTLVINRRLDELGKPLPETIMLGSLRSIAGELGLKDTNTTKIKKALYQNATATITAKLEYKTNDGTIQSLDAVFSRYTLLIFGQQLPNGKKADAVYLILNKYYRDVLNSSPTRPLDHDYLKKLSSSPTAQRFYDYLSYRVYAALKNNSPYAKIRYSDFCTFAPQVRQYDKKRMQQQMSKIHRPHIQDHYIEKQVDYGDIITDTDGKPDWTLTYTIGKRAKAQFRIFSKKQKPREPQLSLTPLLEQTTPSTRAGELVNQLIQHGITEKDAKHLVQDRPESMIRTQLETLPFRNPEDHGKVLYLSIRDNWSLPEAYLKAKAEKERAAQAVIEAERKAAEQHQQENQLKNHHAELESYYNTLTEEDQEQIETQADIEFKNISQWHREQLDKYGRDSSTSIQPVRQPIRYTLIEEELKKQKPEQ